MPRRGALLRSAVFVVAIASLTGERVVAQGGATGSVSGRVTTAQGQPMYGAGIQVVNRATGVRAFGLTRKDGRYLVQGLEVGGPYSVIVRRIGFIPQVRDGQTITLGRELVVDFQLQRQARRLPTVTVMVDESTVMSPERTGAATTVSDSALRRLPSLDRNFTDFVVLAPQVATSGPGLSGGGVNNRYDAIQIDGASENDLFGLAPTGQPGGQARGKSITLEAVKEYQVLLAPYDVRQGNFAGLLVNAVTRSGTNELTGSAFYVTRRAGLARDDEATRASDFSQSQYGFSIGGPLIRDRLHFFVAPEFQQRSDPATGPFVGQSSQPLPVSEADLTRFATILRGYGIDVGSASHVVNQNPLSNMFARLDLAMSKNRRLVMRYNYGRADDDVFSRDPTLFRFGSNAFAFTSSKHAFVAQLYDNFELGGSNELIAGYSRIRDQRDPNVIAPQISAAVPSASGIGTVTLRAGSENSSQGTEVDQDIVELTDNFSLPFGMHRLTIGTQNEIYRVRNTFAQNSYGTWEFTDLDSLARGAASRYQVGVSLGNDIAARFTAMQLGLYGEDQWQATNNLLITAGLRLDMPRFLDRPPFNPAIEQEFGRRTDEVPSGNVQFSPRIGFNWQLGGGVDRDRQLRGGIGLFVARPPFVWLSNAFQNSGLGLGQLTCVNGGGGTPPFVSGDASLAPRACANGATAAAAGDINLLDEGLRFPQHLRASLAYDWRLGGGWVATLEGMYTRAQTSFFYVNRALAGSQGVDRNGRVVYGTIATSGASSPALVSARRNVIDVVNASGAWSYDLSAGVQKQFSNRLEASAAYNYSQARDIQSLTSSVALSNWRFGRAISGDQLAHDLHRSRFETPHRVVLVGTYAAPTNTDLSLIYIGQSGTTYDYVYGGSLGGGRGDLNADGSQGNDLIYVPRSASDPNQIRFSGESSVPGADNSPPAQAQRVADQQAALERFIDETPCLRSQRGRILERNSCRAPWTNTLNVSIHQPVVAFRGQSLALQVDVFNFLNLLNRNWGTQNLLATQPPIALLDHVGQTAGSLTGASGSQGIFTFDPATRRFSSANLESSYQIQLGVRYNF